jgi:hypothetical protein
MTEYARFRQRLDVVLRTQDVKQVQDFLIAENQWHPGSPTDPTFAMWMMIAASPTLSDLHRHAQNWLITHGHEEEAQAVQGRQKKSAGGARPQPSRGTPGARAVGKEPRERLQDVAKRKMPPKR